MNEQLLKLKQLFSQVVPYFGTNHAKVYCSLFDGEIKTAKHLSQETGIAKNKVYYVLNDLVKYGLVRTTNTHPMNYYSKKPQKELGKLVNRRIVLLEKLPEELDKIVENSTAEEKEYLIKFSEKQTKLFDNKNKAIVKEPAEAKQIIKQLNIYIEKIEPKKEYNFAVYR